MSFLRDYLTHASGNEAPPMFHVWSAYSCLSAAISRRVWMVLDDSAIYTNLYILLVGGAGNGKTWSMMKAKRIMAELDLPYSGSVETPQGMWRFMTGDPTRDKPVPPYGGKEHKLFLEWPSGLKDEVHPMNIVASEFIDFISLDDAAWINSLNNIYDEDVYHYRTKGSGEDVIRGPYINLLGGLTTQIAAGMQKDQIINTGLARRTIFQFGERQWNNPHPNPVLTEAQKIAKISAVNWLKRVKSEVRGEFSWTPETDEWWKAWYGPNLAAVPKRSPSVQGWYATKSTQLMKLAMLTSLSERLDKVIEVGHFEVALAYLAECEKDLYKIFGGVGRNELADVALKIFNHCCNLDEPVPFKILKARFFRELPNRRGIDTELLEALNFLVSDDQLKQHAIIVGSLTDVLYAIPAVMDRYLADPYAAPSPPPASTLDVKLSAVRTAVYPSELQAPAQPSSPLPNPNPAQPASSSGVVPPPMVKK